MSRFVQLADHLDRYRSAPDRSRYVIELSSNWADVADQWTGIATPFQNAAWLDAWYGALGKGPEVIPLLVTARDASTGEVAVRCPFIRRRRKWLKTIEFADLHLTDYNAPALGPAAPVDHGDARALWLDIRRALPSADLLFLTKMPIALSGRPNPLALLRDVVSSVVNGNVVDTGDEWMLWRRSLDKTVRKELERSWRVFRREPGAVFERVTEPDRLRYILAAMAVQQQERMRAKGRDYILAQPDITCFYQDLIVRGVASGYAVLTALTAGDKVIAALVGICDAESFVMIRISHAGGRWSTCSPGRLIIEQTMAMLHSEGYRTFDFSVGNHDYKRRFGVRPVPLVDLTEALSSVGHLAKLAVARRTMIGKHPQIAAILQWVYRDRV